MDFMRVMQILSAVLTPLLAFIATAVLVSQYRLLTLRWRLDMWDKRYAIYLVTVDFIKHAVQDVAVTFDEVFKFDRESKGKAFLFGREVETYFEELSQKGLKLQQLGVDLKGAADQDRRNKLTDQQLELVNWFRKQFEVSKNLFGKYLRIGKA
jgi:hypothetical protein